MMKEEKAKSLCAARRGRRLPPSAPAIVPAPAPAIPP